jgi:hypothetical protein
MNRTAYIAMLSGLTLAANAGEIYRWVDRNGVTHFSQDPPNGISYQRVTPQVSPATAAPALDALRKRDAADAAASSAAEQSRQAALKLKADTLERCAKARERITFLEEHPPHRLYKIGPDGQESRYTEEDFAAEMKKAKDAEAQNCS